MTNPPDAWSTSSSKSQQPAGEPWIFVTAEDQELLDLYLALTPPQQKVALANLRRLVHGEGI